MGIQGHSGEGFRLICEWIWAGAIGEVREVDAWCSLSYYPWGHAYWSSKWGARPPDRHAGGARQTELGSLAWTGAGAALSSGLSSGVWRCWWDFGNGMMGDRGAHSLDSVVSSLKFGPPTSVEATSCGLNPETHPLSAIVTFHFPAREGLPPVKLTWYEGTRPPRPPQLEDNQDMPNEGGVIFKGSKGALMCGVYGDSPRLIPGARDEVL